MSQLSNHEVPAAVSSSPLLIDQMRFYKSDPKIVVHPEVQPPLRPPLTDTNCRKYYEYGSYQFQHTIPEEMRKEFDLELYINFEIMVNAHSRPKPTKSGRGRKTHEIRVFVCPGPWMCTVSSRAAYPVHMFDEFGNRVKFVDLLKRTDAEYLLKKHQFPCMASDGSWREVLIVEPKDMSIGPCEYILGYTFTEAC